jgi:hypothetical protein
MTTETMYPWLKAMGVRVIEPKHSKRLVDCRGLTEALELWHHYEAGGELDLDQHNRVQAAKLSSKALPAPLINYLAKQLDTDSANVWAVLNGLDYDQSGKATRAAIEAWEADNKADAKTIAKWEAQYKAIKSKKDDQ